MKLNKGFVMWMSRWNELNLTDSMTLRLPFFHTTREYEQLEEIVVLAAQPLPERPDGIVAVARYTSSRLDNCRATEGEYERMARENPATIFLRCFAEFDNAAILLGKADVQVWPTYDIFYQGEYDVYD